jgi:hypothetical protein
VDAVKNPVSHIAFSSPFRLASCFAALDDSIADQVLKARRVVKHLGGMHFFFSNSSANSNQMTKYETGQVPLANSLLMNGMATVNF